MHARHGEDVIYAEASRRPSGSDAIQQGVEHDSAVRVVAEGLLDGDTAAVRQPGCDQCTQRVRERPRRQREVHRDRESARRVLLGLDDPDEPRHALRVVQLDLAISQPGHHPRADAVRELAGMLAQPGVHVVTELLVGPVLVSAARHLDLQGKPSGRGQPGQRRQQEPPGEVTCRSEHDKSRDHVPSP